MSEAAKWYVVHTYSGYENKVAQNIEKVVENRKLHDLIQEVRVPTRETKEPEQDTAESEEIQDSSEGSAKKKKPKKTKKAENKIYPGYVLIKMIVTDDSWYVVRNTRGCTGFVGPASEPTPLSDEEVRKILNIEPEVSKPKFKEGDHVQISGTAMDGFIGVVRSINLEDQTVDILVSMFGRETPATLSISQVVSVDD